ENRCGDVQGTVRHHAEVRDPVAPISGSRACDPPGRRRSGRALGFLVFGLVLEVANRAADAAADFGQPVGPENDDDDGQHDEQLREPKAAHGDTPYYYLALGPPPQRACRTDAVPRPRA